MPTPDLSALAARLEEFLGSAHDPAGRTPYAPITQPDERVPFPDKAVQMLRCWGLPDYGLSHDRPALSVPLGDAPGGR
ncbi:hypothetical protein AB0E88_31405 [Streptomyces sp. NPDC028635]|uniref:hypothetical protein n=1 Tax=Streptomyces sp. NPDC028635 TaxID=3154800 RepID=UPI0034081A95